MGELINSYPDFTGSFGDKRIAKRAENVLKSLTAGRTSSLRQITKAEAEQKSFYRLFNNESFTEQGIEDCIIHRCSQLSKARHVLCIQDTTDFNFTNHQGRITPETGLGRTFKLDSPMGFMLHSSLVIDADKSTALGFSSINMWFREAKLATDPKRLHQHFPIAEKESYKWIESTQQSSALLQDAERITIIADRESDIYDMLSGDYGSKVDLLLRCSFNRKLHTGIHLNDHLSTLPVRHQYQLQIRGDVRTGITQRVAQMEVKWDKVTLCKPKNCKGNTHPKTKEVYIVEAKENKAKGLVWRLYVTRPITTVAEAVQIIDWYKQRWHIEQIHRLLKTDGFRIEQSQLEQGWALRKLTMLAMMATLRILQMMLAYEDDAEKQDISEVFTPEEVQCLNMISAQMEGATMLLKNTSNPNKLKWATWVIARLGGWKGYKSQRKPGPIVLQKGLAQFYAMFNGWLLYQNFTKDVSSP
jgi:hypothetical protein